MDRANVARIGVSLTLATLLVLYPGAVRADNWFGNTGNAGECDKANMTDNKTVEVIAIDTVNKLTDAVSWYSDNILDPTELDGIVTTNPDAHNDIRFYDNHYEDWCGKNWTVNGYQGVMGTETCRFLASSGRCDQARVRISTVYINQHEFIATRWIVCHEGGHGLGLKHRESNDACMSIPLNPPWGERNYTDHDRDHINASW